MWSKKWRFFTYNYFSHIKRARNLRTFGFASAFLLLVFAIVSVFPIVNHTEEAEATATPSTTTLTVSSSSTTANINLAGADTTGVFAASSSDIAFSVTTNNLTGYILTIAGNDNNGKLTNSAASSTLDPLTSAISASTFSNASNTTYNGKWGYKPSKLNSSANTNYLPAPTTTATTLDTTSSANTTANNYTIGLGARVDYTKPAGNYTNTFILAAVGRPVLYEINYLDNTSDANVSGLPAQEASTTTVVSGFTLSSSTPTRTGYTFNKWCLGTVTHIAGGNSTCSGTQYSAGPSFTFSSPSATTASVANLYAMWNVRSYSVKVNFANAGVSSVVFTATGQTTRTVSTSGGTASLVYGVPYSITMNLNNGYSFASWALNSASYGTLGSTSVNPTTFTIKASSSGIITATPTALYMQDLTSATCQSTASSSSITRVDKRDGNDYQVRYINGNCWMVQNLRYVGDTGSASGSMVMKTATSNIAANTTISYTDLTNGNDYSSARIHDSGDTTNGVWYNYAAISAMTITGSSNFNTATYSVCPKGWRLPSKLEQSTIASYTVGTTDYQTAFFNGDTPFGGYYNYGSVDSVGAGFWWGSTANEATNRYYLNYHDDITVVAAYGIRDAGLSARCILGSLPADITAATYMQEVTASMVANTAEGATATLIDSRDTQQYTVAKINGNLWMTRNLAIGCAGSGSSYSGSRATRTLTTSDSNTSGSYTINTSNVPNLTGDSDGSYTKAYMQCNSTYGAWYNYKAATAGTISGSSNSTNATKDICPLGWRLPTNSEQTGIKGSTYTTVYKPVKGGRYSKGTKDYTDRGYWWSATKNSATDRYYMNYSSSLGTSSNPRFVGFYVRCIKTAS